jgi:cyanophycinase-like exopeptidase
MVFLYLILSNAALFAQSYTSYFTGNATDIVTNPSGGICMMGGATEHDEAMKWFLQNSNGGDILVLRATGSNGYNTYLYSDLGIPVNSVETIVFNNAGAANDPYVQQKVAQAEAIWFAGGDQWDYITYWRNTPIDSIINEGLLNRHIVIGGTSAGMAIQGKFYFSAANGSVTTAQALANPYHVRMTVDSLTFLKNKFMEEVITDTHYDNPDRKGRHVAFLARIFKDWSIGAKGIACDEYTAVCIDTSGIAHCYGDYPAYDEDIYFLQTNCDLSTPEPENCTAGTSLNWNRGTEAVKVYRVKGTQAGNNTFSMVDWNTGVGGTWEHWYVNNGSFQVSTGTPPNCAPVSLEENTKEAYSIYPNPVTNGIVTISGGKEKITGISVYDSNGKLVKSFDGKQAAIDISDLRAGLYLIRVLAGDGIAQYKIVKN